MTIYDDQPDLFPPYQRHSDTSFWAAVEINCKAETLRRRVLDFLVRGPATDELMQTVMNLNPSTQRPRRVELVDCGLVRDSGRRGQTRSGRKAVIWEVTKEKRAGRWQRPGPRLLTD